MFTSACAAYRYIRLAARVIQRERAKGRGERETRIAGVDLYRTAVYIARNTITCSLYDFIFRLSRAVAGICILTTIMYT